MDPSRVLFVGPRIPVEWTRAIPLLKHVDQPLFRSLLSAAIKLESTDTVDDTVLQNLKTDKLPLDSVLTLFAGVLALYRSAVRQPSIKAAVLKEDLKELKLSPELSVDFVKAVDSSREAAIAAAVHDKPALPSLEQLQWRVDVSISTGALSRVLRPTILMQMTLSDNSVTQFEVPLTHFHELRYNVASILKDMEAINQRNVFKIKD